MGCSSSVSGAEKFSINFCGKCCSTDVCRSVGGVVKLCNNYLSLVVGGEKGGIGGGCTSEWLASAATWHWSFGATAALRTT